MEIGVAGIDDGPDRRRWCRPMRDDVRRALAIDASSTIEDRTIDITTTGRRSGEPRRIEIAFYRVGDDVYLSGVPGPSPRDWLANLAARPRTATVIVDPAERRRILAVFVDEFNRRHGPDSPWPEAVLDEWVEHSPLAKVIFVETE